MAGEKLVIFLLNGNVNFCKASTEVSFFLQIVSSNKTFLFLQEIINVIDFSRKLKISSCTS